MQIRTRVLIGLTAAVLTSGCASSGGSGKVTNADGTASDMTGEDFFLCLITFGLNCGGEPASSTTTTTTATASVEVDRSFSRWSALERGKTTAAVGTAAGFSGPQVPIENTKIDPTYDKTVRFSYGSNGELLSIDQLLVPAGSPDGSLAPIGHAGIDTRESMYLGRQAPFTSIPKTDVGAIANPFKLGWEYQTFGVWTNVNSSGNSASLVTFGSRTLSGQVPSTGSAAFTGKLAGFYLSSTGTGYTAAADLSVQANFENRTLHVGSSRTTLTRDFATGMAAPNLDVSGTLSYAAGSNTFSGNLTSAGGTMSGNSQGRFYGPAAQELGGVFTLRSATTTETFAGAYGAKR